MKIDVEILCTACKRGWMESGRVEDGHMNHTVAVCEACAREALAARDEENAELRARIAELEQERAEQEQSAMATAASLTEWLDRAVRAEKERDALQQRCERLEKALQSASDTAKFERHPWRPWQDEARAALTPTETPGK